MAVYKIKISSRKNGELNEISTDFIISARSQSSAINAAKRHLLCCVECETLSADKLFSIDNQNAIKIDALACHEGDNNDSNDSNNDDDSQVNEVIENV